MDDTAFGSRDRSGHWVPLETAQPAPMWQRPFSIAKLLAWLPGYLWPWNAFHLATALLWVLVLIPSWESLATLSLWNYLYLYALNTGALLLFLGGFEMVYYVKRKQGTRFKYNPAFPSEHPSAVFWFKSQNIDNFLRTVLVSLPLWTLVELVLLWAYANSWAVWLPWTTHWLWLSVVILLAPAVHEVYFYFLHRAIHWGPLYRHIHSVHHLSQNPSPWSSLSMHPGESLPYMGEALLHLLIPSNPVCAYFTLHSVGFGAANGHLGFEKFELTETRTLDSHAYLHYLHHRFFEVNYGGEGLVPLDYWLGTWHDGTPDSEQRFRKRILEKKRREKARREARAEKVARKG